MVALLDRQTFECTRNLNYFWRNFSSWKISNNTFRVFQYSLRKFNTKGSPVFIFDILLVEFTFHWQINLFRDLTVKLFLFLYVYFGHWWHCGISRQALNSFSITMNSNFQDYKSVRWIFFPTISKHARI